MTRSEARKIIERFLSIGYQSDGKPRTEKDIAILIAIKALDNMIYLEEQMGRKDKDVIV